MIDKKRILILLKVLDHIQQDNENARNVGRSIAAICKGEGISFEQVFYILFFDAVLVSNKSSFSFYSREFILGHSRRDSIKREKTCKFAFRFPQTFLLYTHFELKNA